MKKDYFTIWNKFAAKAKKVITSLFLMLMFFASMVSMVYADWTVQPGETYTLSAGETFTVNGNLTIDATGTLDASVAGTNIVVSGNWSNAGTFTAGTGTVTINGAGTSVITGSNTFYNFTCETASKQLTFEAGSTQTVTNTLTLDGQAAGTKIVLRSTVDGTRWTFDVTSGAQVEEYLDVKDSQTSTNNIYALNSTNSGGNDDTETTPFWVFGPPATIISPITGKTIGQQPTLVGTSTVGSTVTIQGLVGTVSTTVATVTADANGNFRVVQSDYTASLDMGANTLTPTAISVLGTAINITVAASPTTDQVPTIVSPENGKSIRGAQPTISGKGLAGQTVTLKASDADGNLLLSSVAASTVDVNGNYTINASDYSTTLPKGSVTLHVEVDDVSSDVVTVSFVDPFGVVFDSIANRPISDAVVTLYYDNDAGVGRDWITAVAGTHMDAGDVNPQTTDSTGEYAYNVISGDYRIDISVSGYDYPSVQTDFPSGRVIVTGSQGEAFTIGSLIVEMDHPMDPNATLLRIEKDANKKDVSVGSIVTYTLTIQNLSVNEVLGVYLEDKIPAGFKYISGKTIIDGEKANDPSGNRPIIFNIGTMAGGSTTVLKYQLIVGSGVTFGNYENRAFARYSNGWAISNNAVETVKVVPDVLFDLGAVIGKVFYDHNKNGRQDAPVDGKAKESPVPYVQIVMEDGTVVITDEYGRFSVPGIAPGRHIFRLDERTLPQGHTLTTRKGVVVDVTPGLLTKVNFGVKAPEGQAVYRQSLRITRDRHTPVPRLNVSLWKDTLVYDEKLGVPRTVEFRIFTNYSLFIKEWHIVILDQDTKRIIKTLFGTRKDIFELIRWDGLVEGVYPFKEEGNYAYQLTAIDDQGNKDISKEKSLTIKRSKNIQENEEEDQIVREGEMSRWFDKENKVNVLETQMIPVQGETVVINNILSRISGVRIKRSGKNLLQLPLGVKKGLTSRDILNDPLEIKAGRMKGREIDIVLPQGEYDIQALVGELDSYQEAEEKLAAMDAEDKGAEDIVYKDFEHITIGDDYLFFVSMADAKLGYTFASGQIEPVQQNDQFKSGFWSEGKLAYYLKGKIKGKYLITSSFDSKRRNKELFKNINKDEYYPVYGDTSTINYAAANTQGNLYLLIEWDKSSAVWGNYSVNFNETEFAQFARTFYGGKMHVESLETTPYGEARAKAIIFRAKAQQKSGHNEFLATGVSLYYLKHTNITEGSDRIRVEVRDKITGLVLSTYEMKESVDYEMDYQNGRMIFWKSIPILVESYSIISSELLDGNLVYVVADYAYDVKDKFDEDSVGVRVQQAVTDFVHIGGTYVEENQTSSNYKLEGVDAKVRLGSAGTVKVEYAQSSSESGESFISTDGGLTFTELTVADTASGKAYGISGNLHLFNRLGMSGYYKWIDNDFSGSSTTSQQGKELIGFSGTFDVSENTRVTARHDIQGLIDDGNAHTQAQVGASRTATTMVQILHQIKKLKLTGEYRHQDVSQKKEPFKSQTNKQEDVFALRADYQLATDKVTLSIEQQTSLQEGKSNNQTSLGITVKPKDGLVIKATETIGQGGTATSIGVTADMNERLSLSGDYAIKTDQGGGISNTATVGASTKINEVSEIKMSMGLSQKSNGNRSSTMALGGSSQIDEKTYIDSKVTLTDVSSQRRTSSISFGARRKIAEELEVSSTQSIDMFQETQKRGHTYGVKRTKDGKVLEATLSTTETKGKGSISKSNIFGLSGDINDRWAFTGTFAKGDVQNYDGTQTARNAFSAGLGYVKKDEETRRELLKSSTKIEMVLDEGTEDKRQYTVYHSMKGKINPNTTFFAKSHFSSTRNTTQKFTEASYKELTLGAAFRPVDFDRLNMMIQYTYLADDSPASQIDISDIQRERSHIFATEAVYDVTDYLQIVNKLAYKKKEETITGFDATPTETWLMIHRFNYNFDNDWQLGAEYRILNQEQAKDQKQGALVELSKNVNDSIQISIGYNFTEFNDDLTHLDYKAYGPFVRITSNLNSLTSEEKEVRAKRREVKVLYKEAISLYRENLLDSSRDTFNKILVLDTDHQRSRDYLKDKIPHQYIRLQQLHDQRMILIERKLIEFKWQMIIHNIIDKVKELYEEGNLKGATEKLRIAYVLHPENEEVLAYLKIIQRDLDLIDSSYPVTIQRLISEAEELYARGDYQGVMVKSKIVLTLDFKNKAAKKLLRKARRKH